MDFATRTVHPLGGFDLTAIGLVLVVVLAVMVVRRMRRGEGDMTKSHDDWSNHDPR